MFQLGIEEIYQMKIRIMIKEDKNIEIKDTSYH